MTQAPSLLARQLNSAFGRERDRRIFWLLEMHPVTATILVALRWFPNKNKALGRLRRLAARRRIRLVGTVCRKATGRPEHVYCRWRPKLDNLLQEIELTELCLRIDAGYIRRGPAVKDRAIRPDAEVEINRRLYYLELDRGSMRHGQIAQRFRKYESCKCLSLWVCANGERMETMRQQAERLRHTSLFTTFAEAIAGPHRPIWHDHHGGTAELPQDSIQENPKGSEAGH